MSCTMDFRVQTPRGPCLKRQLRVIRVVDTLAKHWGEVGGGGAVAEQLARKLAQHGTLLRVLCQSNVLDRLDAASARCACHNLMS